MTDFAKSLEKYIYRSTLTESQLAKISGFNRSYIALIKNGQRVPADMEKVRRLITALNLSPYEYDTLWKEYLKARYGEENFELQSQIVNFIEGFEHQPRISIMSNYQHEIPDIKSVNNRMDLDYMVKAVVENEALRENGKLRLIVQSDFEFLFNLLPCVYRNSSRLTIEHIVCLEGGMAENKGLLYNLKFFGKMIPIILSEKESRYHIDYYYDKVTSHFASSVLMPYVVISSDCVINISVDLNHALISKDVDVIGLYNLLFDLRKRECRPMLHSIGENDEYLELCQEKPKEPVEAVYSIGSQPCFGLLDIESMIFKYINRDRIEAAYQFQKLIQENKRFVSDEKMSIISYFSKVGLKSLMEDGIVKEVPRELYTALEVEDRKKLIEMLIEAIEAGWYTAFLLDDNCISYPENLIITAKEMTSVNIFYLPENNESRFALQEQSLSKMIYDFLVDFGKSTYVLSKEETLKYLKKIIR
ncbi:helix-turn-helix domain-containing protein [Frisingicoccus sp.]|uniref:helix-turn-helix domain-containing protein n=1 Tax=Frisingicoccus sp. TaxID=1918627 RepID=UPI003AB40C44